VNGGSRAQRARPGGTVLRGRRNKSGLPLFMLGVEYRTLSSAKKKKENRLHNASIPNFSGLKVAGYDLLVQLSIPYSSEADFAIDSISPRLLRRELCFLGSRAPRQELFAARCLDQLNGPYCSASAPAPTSRGYAAAPPSLTQKVVL